MAEDKEAWAGAHVVDYVRFGFFASGAGILVLLSCCVSCSDNCACIEWCPSLLKRIKKFTVDFAQFLYGPTSITLNDDESTSITPNDDESTSITPNDDKSTSITLNDNKSPLVISKKKFQSNRGNILIILFQNFIITGMTVIAASKMFITQVRTNECDENWPCFFTNGTQLDNLTNCSEYVNTEIVCFYIDISPLQTIGFIGGFFKVATPLSFKISTLFHLSLPYYLNTKFRCASCGDCAMKIVLYFTYFFLYVGAVTMFGINTFGLVDYNFNKVIDTIFAGKLGKGTTSNVIDFIAIMIVIFNFPWYVVLKREGETESQCTSTRSRGYEKCVA